MGYPKNQAYTNTTAESTNTELVLTVPAYGDSLHRSLQHLSWSFGGDPEAAILLTVESPANTVIQQWSITKGGPGFIDFGKPGVEGAAGEAIIVRLAEAVNTTATLNGVADES